jgi:hypothetical protein
VGGAISSCCPACFEKFKVQGSKFKVQSSNFSFWLIREYIRLLRKVFPEGAFYAPINSEGIGGRVHLTYLPGIGIKGIAAEIIILRKTLRQ